MSAGPTKGQRLPGADLDPARMPAHWLLARMGKRVLRPGGRELTGHLLGGLDVSRTDDVVELAPGLGTTTRLLLDRAPRTYIGIERDERAAAAVRALARRDGYDCRTGSAEATGLDSDSATVVFGEAYLTMQPDVRKRDVLHEAFRVLKPRGRFGLHELALVPDSLPPERQEEVRADLSGTLRVGARPLTPAGWRALLEDVGFELRDERAAPMSLLGPRRLVRDEGPVGAARFTLNVLRDKDARTRVRAIRTTFRRHGAHLAAIMLVATKPDTGQ